MEMNEQENLLVVLKHYLIITPTMTEYKTLHTQVMGTMMPYFYCIFSHFLERKKLKRHEINGAQK